MFSTGFQPWLDPLFISEEIFNDDYCVVNESDYSEESDYYTDGDCYGETNDYDRWCDEMDYDGPDGEQFCWDERSDYRRDRLGRRVLRSC